MEDEAPLVGARFLATGRGAKHRRPVDQALQAIPRPRQGVALIACLISATPWGGLLGDPQGVEGVGMGLCTSVTASRMTDAYGASTLRVPPGCPPWYMITLMPKCVTPDQCIRGVAPFGVCKGSDERIKAGTLHTGGCPPFLLS